MCKRLSICLFIFLCYGVKGQSQKYFDNSFSQLNDMLENEEKYSFKKAVFSVENAFLEGKLDTLFVNSNIKAMNVLCNSLIKNRFLYYPEKDKEKVNKWASVFQVMCDTIPLDINDKIYKYAPFGYDFNDVFGHKDRENLLVYKLLKTRKGNCHSLPYLYKILAEELGVEANLALAPNHVYIKHKSLKDGWYNTELTSGIFPIDAWLMASGYIHVDAITNGVYMKALNNKESIALVLIDLAEHYNYKFPKNDGSFILKCCELSLKYYPNFVQALILRAEIHKTKIDAVKDKAMHDKLFSDLEKEYAHIHELGYRNMPERMYLNWLVSLKSERSKYENKKLNTFNKN